MILTDHTITAEINNGNIVVEPFKKDETKAGAYTEQVKKQVVTEDFGDLPF